MSLRAAFLFLALALPFAPGAAIAQEETRVDRFYAEKVSENAEPVFQGRLTSSTFFAQELGESISNANGLEVADNASPFSRLYSELRAQLGWVQPGMNRLDVRADARVRMALPCELAFVKDPSRGLDPGQIGYDECRTQSGTYGGNEYDIRELYGRRVGNGLTLQAGRQYVAEIAATKVDGVKVQYALDGNWSLIGFGGLAPSRISRSLLDDYAGGVLPIGIGAGGAYRFDRYFGSIGAAGIVPISSQNADAAIQPRTFVTSNGYWRPSVMFDVYHYLSVDISGPSTEELSDLFTNVSLGMNVKPTEDLRVTAALHHFSTDTLEEFALERLELRDPMQGTIQNNIDVLRLAAQSARLGVSLAVLEKRFEVSTSFALRRRLPETICPANNLDCDPSAGQTSLDAWSGEAMLGVVDRQSIGGLRLGASLINMFGVYFLGLGDESYGRSNHLAVRLDASRELMQGLMQVDADLSYLKAQDIGNAECMPNAPLTCYGETFVDTVSGGGTLFYRFSPDWFGMLTANAALQAFKPQARGEMVTSYSNTLLTAFLRLAYRF